MNLRNDLYPIKNKLIKPHIMCNENNTVWILTKINYKQVLNMLVEKHQRYITQQENEIRKPYIHEIFIALPRNAMNRGLHWCQGNPKTCSTIGKNEYPCNECQQLRKKYEAYV